MHARTHTLMHSSLFFSIHSWPKYNKKDMKELRLYQWLKQNKLGGYKWKRDRWDKLNEAFGVGWETQCFPHPEIAGGGYLIGRSKGDK